MERLRKSLHQKIWWVLGLGLVYLLIALTTSFTLLQWVFGVVAVVHAFVGLVIYSKYRKLLAPEHTPMSLLENALHHRKAILHMLRLENYALLAVFPAMVLGSMVLGYSVGRGNIEDLFNLKFLYLYLLLMAIGTPLLLWLGSKLNKKAFGPDLAMLNDHIRALQKAD